MLTGTARWRERAEEKTSVWILAWFRQDLLSRPEWNSDRNLDYSSAAHHGFEYMSCWDFPPHPRQSRGSLGLLPSMLRNTNLFALLLRLWDKKSHGLWRLKWSRNLLLLATIQVHRDGPKPKPCIFFFFGTLQFEKPRQSCSSLVW